MLSEFSQEALDRKRKRALLLRAASEAATIKMAGEALEALSPRQLIDVLVVTFMSRKSEILTADKRALAQLFDRAADEDER